jgi:hypothetical protein
MVYDFTFIEQDEADVGTQFYKSMDFVSQLVYAFFMKIPPAPSTKGGVKRILKSGDLTGRGLAS